MEDELINKSITARGGMENLKAMESQVWTGEAELVAMGMALPLTIYQKRPGMLRSEVDVAAAGMMIVTGFDGTTTARLTNSEGFDLPAVAAWAEGETPPASLDRQGMQAIRKAFVEAAGRAHRLGIDVIEIHAAHGYLLHQFLSPLSNVRDDAYGGSLENRLRFPLEVFEAVRAAVPPELPVGIRISATDWVEGGWDIEQSLALAQALKQQECAFIHVSSGGLSPLQQIPSAAGFQVPFAERIRRETGLPTIAVGLITQPEQAERIVAEGQADLVALARGMLYDPHWPWHAAAALGAQVTAPPQYWRSAPAGAGTLFKS
jgi:2,4-dienoyl-CoA reductase-like NADH-dependent reductase (Old Yellow Enzyme family)